MRKVRTALWILTVAVVCAGVCGSPLFNTRTALEHNNLEALNIQSDAHEQYPYVVVLVEIRGYSSVHEVCSGAMLAPAWLLTSANCFRNMSRTLFVWYGNYTVSPLRTLMYSEVTKVYRHPAYNVDTMNNYYFIQNAIGLASVNKIDLKSYGRVLPVDYTALFGLPGTYFERETEERSGDLSRPLRTLEGVIVSCPMATKKKARYQVCVSPRCPLKMRAPLATDLGGPLVLSGHVVGPIVHFDFDNTYLLPVVSPVSPYLDWMASIMGTHVTTLLHSV